MSLKIVSEDWRRSLYEFGEGKWKCAKYVEVKDNCEIGNHFHLLKDECFLLVDGVIEELYLENRDEPTMINIKAPFVIDVPRGLYHKFKIKAGSKLIGLMSEEYNHNDDHV
jgi:hypothetical protein